MNHTAPIQQLLTRRAFLGRSSAGMGMLALASLLKPEVLRGDTGHSDRWTGMVNPLHFAPKAKRVIYLYMAGGPSHLETFDYRPKLAQMHGKPIPEPFSARQWHSGFLPSRFQGVEFRSKGDPVLYVNSPSGVNTERQRDVVDAVQTLNRMQNSVVEDPEIATRISQYEMAFRMQTSV